MSSRSRGCSLAFRPKSLAYAYLLVRTDARRRSSVQSNPSSPQPQPPYRPHSDPNRITYQHPHPVHPPPIAIPSPNIPQSSLSAPPRSLVWRDQDPFRRTSAPLHNPVAHMPYHPPPPPPPLSNHGPSAGMIGPSHGSIPGPSHLGPIHLETAPPPRPRFMDDGMPPTLRDLSSPLNWTREYFSCRSDQGPVPA